MAGCFDCYWLGWFAFDFVCVICCVCNWLCCLLLDLVFAWLLLGLVVS